MKKSMRQKFLLPISMVFLILFAATDLESPAFADPITSIQVGIYEGVLQRSFSYTPSHISIANKQGDIFECVQYGLDNCAISEPTARLSGVLVFPPCEESATGPCIEKVEFRLKERPWSAASLVRSIFAPKRQAENELGYPEGGSMSLWRSPQVPNSLGSGDYAVYVRSEGGTSPGAKWSFGNLTARIIPFKLIDGAFTEQRMVESKLGLITGYENLEGRSRLSQTTFAPYSVWSDRLGKGELAEWLPGTAARLTLKIPSTLGGWIGGRISDVEFSMSNESAKFNTLVIGGSSLAVNEVNVTIPVEKIPQKLREIYPITNPPTIAGYFLGL
jgi:hypothetical protein